MTLCNERLNIIKGFAILSVISAHCNSVTKTSAYITLVQSKILSSFGTVGVVLFFVVSGFLFHPEKYTPIKFWKNKAKFLVIPWFISAVAVYLYVYLRKSGIGIFSFVRFFIGSGSYCYYLTVLLCCYLLFYFKIMRSRIVLILCELCTLISILFFYSKGISSYLDLTNWIGFFAFGIHINEFSNDFKNIVALINKIWFVILISITYVALVILQIFSGNHISYWGYRNVPVVIMGSLCLFLVSGLVVKFEIFAKKVGFMGKNSLFVYLWHMPFAGISTKFLPQITILRPLIISLVLGMVIWTLNIIIKKLKMSKLALLIGLKG